MNRSAVGSGQRYRPSEPLGEDELGTLWSGTDPLSGAPVIVRLLDERLTSDAGAVHQATNGLERMRGHAANQHLPRVLHHNLRRPGERPALVVFEGSGVETLARRLERGGLSTRVALHVIAAVTDGLASAHEAWVYHGVLSSASVIVDSDAVVKVIDVGLGELLPDRGTTPMNISDRGAADVLAVAVLLEQMLGGAPRWQATFDDGGPQPWQDEVPTNVRVLMRRAQSPHRLQRPKMAELAAALAPALAPIPDGDSRFGGARSAAPPSSGSAEFVLPARPSAPPPPRPDHRAVAPAETADAAAAASAVAPSKLGQSTTSTTARKPRHRRRRVVLVAIVGSVLLVGASVGGVFALRALDAGRDRPAGASGTPAPSVSQSVAASVTPSVTPSVTAALEPATVPALIGVRLERATELLQRAGLVVGSITTVPGRSGVVVRSEPTQGEAVAAGTTVALFVGNGAEG